MTADDVNPDLVTFIYENLGRVVLLFAPGQVFQGVPHMSEDGASIRLQADDNPGFVLRVDATKVVAWRALS